MKIDHYVHITSPIRRLVDLLNQMIFINQTKPISEKATLFIQKWSMETINTSMKAIRKVQVDSQLVYLCFTHPEIMENTYRGFVFDKTIDGDFHYMVYLEEIKLLSRIKSKVELTDTHQFKIFLFEDEDKIKNKIRLQRI
jgi:exoribonuclease R